MVIPISICHSFRFCCIKSGGGIFGTFFDDGKMLNYKWNPAWTPNYAGKGKTCQVNLPVVFLSLLWAYSHTTVCGWWHWRHCADAPVGLHFSWVSLPNVSLHVNLLNKNIPKEIDFLTHSHTKMDKIWIGLFYLDSERQIKKSQ